MRIGRRGFLKTAVGAPALLATQPSQPNVLFVLADEWRAQALGYSGDPNVHTTVLDRFAAESVNFENAVSGHPVCCPFRASLMTGQYPLTNGLFVNDEELKPTGTTLGQSFAKAGYQTGYIGKWHLYGSPDGKYGRRLAYIPPDHRFGFQYWKACECTHDYNHSPLLRRRRSRAEILARLRCHCADGRCMPFHRAAVQDARAVLPGAVAGAAAFPCEHRARTLPGALQGPRNPASAERTGEVSRAGDQGSARLLLAHGGAG